jgi:AcrR family transcriptional regulator
VTHRAAQKLQTRQALLDAALRLMEDRSLDGLSLREVTLEVGIVPAAFYRHFPDMASLGVALVERSLGSLRTTIRAVRAGLTESEELVRRSIDVLAREVHHNRAEFRFIARERNGGVPRVRQAIREQLHLFSEELAADLIAGEMLDRWPPDDVRMLTRLVVNQMVQTGAAILDVPPDQPRVEREVLSVARRQLRLIFLGSQHWLD